MKKLTKKSLDELAEIMPVIGESEQRKFMGGLDPKDCVWRCIAYLMSCGGDYSAEAGMGYARGYSPDDFNENSYAFQG
ncbi:MAG: hypothetical protein ACK5L5_11810, partial [Bacteroidales bacterium]